MKLSFIWMKILNDIFMLLKLNWIWLVLKEIWIELNWILIQFNNWIKIHLRRNGMQIGGKGIENFLVHMLLGKKTQKETNLKRHLSMLLFLKIA